MATIKKAESGITLSGPTIYGKKKPTPTEKYATSEPIKSRTDLDAKGNFVNTGKYKTVTPKKTPTKIIKCGGKISKKKGK